MKNKFLALLISSAFLFVACDDSSSASAAHSTEESSSSVEEGEDSSSSEKDAKSSSSEDGDKLSSSEKSSGKSSSSEKSSDNSSSSAKEDSKSSSSVSEDKSSSSESPKSSSSETQVSSSSETPESSSTEVSSSSVVTPEGARAAKLTDLQKNYELKLFDQTVYLSTGSKQGVLALRIPDELWVVTYTDFAGGVVSFKKDKAGLQYSETDAVKKIIGKMDAGFKISFVVKEADYADEDDTILYSVDGGDYSEAVKASVAVQKSKVSKAETIQKKIYECADGDSTRTFKFFDSSYIYETSIDGQVVNWHAGRYDIQRNTLLMLPIYYVGSSRTMFTYSVGTDNKITAYNGESMDCTVEEVEYDYEDAKDFVGEWVKTQDGVDWTFTLNANGTSKLEAFEGSKRVELKSGTWEVYGYYMVMDYNTLLNPGSTTSTYGHLQTGTVDRETGKISGFSFIHHDKDTPRIPYSFEAPEYKE